MAQPQPQPRHPLRRRSGGQRRLLRRPPGGGPTEASATCAPFALPSGVGLGLWSRRTAAPEATAAGGGAEIAFEVDDVDAVHLDWRARGLRIAQAPTDMAFGRTFVALGPDGHRLRVFAPAAAGTGGP